MKSYTDLSQSRKLAEILPLESADMYYEYVLPRMSGQIAHNPQIGNPINALEWFNKGYAMFGKGNPLTLNEFCVPCWSLASLLNVLPKIVNTQTLFIETSAALWHIGYRDVYIARSENPVDACVDMIIKLKELNLL